MKKVLLIVIILLGASTVNAQVSSSTARRFGPTTFAGLGTPANNAVRWCTNCQATSPCTSGGTGAYAYRSGGAWNCGTGASGTGDVVGPASSTDNAVARYDSTTGKLIQNSAVTIADTTGNITGPQKLTLGTAASATGSIELRGTTSGTVTVKPADAAGTWSFTLPIDDGTSGQYLQTNGSGVTSWQTVTAGVNGSTGGTDNAVLRADGTGGTTLQNSGVTIDDSNNVNTAGYYAIIGGSDLRFTKANNPFGSPSLSLLDNTAAPVSLYSLNVISNGGSIGNVSTNSTNLITFIKGSGGISVRSGDSIGFASSAADASAGDDAGIARQQAKVTELHAGTPGTAGVGLIRGQAFASLPASPVAGMFATVTDSSTATWGATITGGGANVVLAFYNGANWTVAAK